MGSQPQVTPPSGGRQASPSVKDRLRARKRGARTRSALGLTALVGGGLAVAGILVYYVVRPPSGEAVEILSAGHVLPPTPPGPFNTDPPTSGTHYADPLERGFYDEEQVAALPPYPEGNLVHSLEHDYTIVWYNCAPLSESDCQTMKVDIRAALDSMSSSKVIAFPWPSQAEPVVYTHWGRILRLQEFDERALVRFHRTNLGRAPEPGAP